jgi:hypothetical protein
VVLCHGEEDAFGIPPYFQVYEGFLKYSLSGQNKGIHVLGSVSLFAGRKLQGARDRPLGSRLWQLLSRIQYHSP